MYVPKSAVLDVLLDYQRLTFEISEMFNSMLFIFENANITKKRQRLRGHSRKKKGTAQRIKTCKRKKTKTKTGNEK